MKLDNYFKLKMPFFLILLFCGSLVLYDIRLNGTFQKSTTHKWLENSGVLSIYRTASKEISTRLPVVIDSLNRSTGPYIDSLWNSLAFAYGYCTSRAEPFTKWCNKNIPPRLEYLGDTLVPWIKGTVNSGADFFLHIGDHLSSSQQSIKDYSLSLGSWMHENLNLGSKSFARIQVAFTDLVHSIQSTMIDSFNWVHHQLVG